MYTLRLNLIAATLFVFLFSACKHPCDCEDDGVEPCAFSYERAAYTPNGAPGDQLVAPVFDADKPSGAFSARPAGLSIDPKTGVIDVNASEFGKEYKVQFRIKNSEVICETNIFIDEPEAEKCSFSYSKEGVVAPGEADFLTPTFADGYQPKGKFTAYPSGLDISPDKGIVNVSASASGVQYFITYISDDMKTICQTTLLITGVDYPETIINFDEGERILEPYFNEQGDGRSTFGSYEASPSDLAFVETQQGVQNGSIDLFTTLAIIQEEEFNGQLPEGFFRDYTISYTLFDDNETSSTAELRIYYYSSLEAAQELAPELLEALEDRGNFTGNNGRIEKKPKYAMAIGAVR